MAYLAAARNLFPNFFFGESVLLRRLEEDAFVVEEEEAEGEETPTWLRLLPTLQLTESKATLW